MYCERIDCSDSTIATTHFIHDDLEAPCATSASPRPWPCRLCRAEALPMWLLPSIILNTVHLVFGIYSSETSRDEIWCTRGHCGLVWRDYCSYRGCVLCGLCDDIFHTDGHDEVGCEMEMATKGRGRRNSSRRDRVGVGDCGLPRRRGSRRGR